LSEKPSHAVPSYTSVDEPSLPGVDASSFAEQEKTRLADYQSKCRLYFSGLIGIQDANASLFNPNAGVRQQQIGNNRSVRQYMLSSPNKNGSIYTFSLGSGYSAPDANLIEHPTLFITLNKAQSYSFLPSWIISKPIVYSRLSELIDSIQLHIGGQSIDSINGNQLEFLLQKYQLQSTYRNNKLMVPLPFDLFWGQNALAFSRLKYHEVSIQVKLKSETMADIANMNLRMDKYTINEYCNDSTDQLNYPLYMSKYRTEPINSELGLAKYQLNTNHPVSDIYFYFTDANNQIVKEDCFDQVVLKFGEITHDIYEADNLLCESPLPDLGLYVINFGNNETINFSKVNDGHLEFTNLKSIDGLKIHCGIRNRNIGQQLSGLFGLRYSC
jgi:hypothetical protein